MNLSSNGYEFFEMSLPNGEPRMLWLPFDVESPFVGPLEWAVDDQTDFDVPIGLSAVDSVLDDPNPPAEVDRAALDQASREERVIRGENLVRGNFESAVALARDLASARPARRTLAEHVAWYWATVTEANEAARARRERRAADLAAGRIRPPPGVTRPIRRRRPLQYTINEDFFPVPYHYEDDEHASGNDTSGSETRASAEEEDEDEADEDEEGDEDAEEEGDEDAEEEGDEDAEEEGDEEEEDDDDDDDDDADAGEGEEGEGDGDEEEDEHGDDDGDEMPPWERRAWNFILHAIASNRSLTFPELVEYHQVFLRDDYRERIVARATDDSRLSVIWQPNAYVPDNLTMLAGPGLRYFARSHALPPYIPTIRLTHEIVATRAPLTDDDRGPRRIIVGPTIIDLVSNLDARALAATTAGSLVQPQVGRTYSLDDIYPRPGQPELADFVDARANGRTHAQGRYGSQSSDDMDVTSAGSDDDEDEGDEGDGNEAGDEDDDHSDRSNMNISSAESEEPTSRRRLSTIELTDEEDTHSPPCAPVARRLSTIDLSSSDEQGANGTDAGVEQGETAHRRRLSTVDLTDDTPVRHASLINLTDDAPVRHASVIDLTNDSDSDIQLMQRADLLVHPPGNHTQHDTGYISSDELRYEEDLRVAARAMRDAVSSSPSSSEDLRFLRAWPGRSDDRLDESTNESTDDEL
ncbi:hypothetical protein GGG16DRAFT_118985 [Schizophyllum commune]